MKILKGPFFLIKKWKNNEKILQTALPNGSDMLIDGRAPNVGEIMHMPNLAR